MTPDESNALMREVTVAPLITGTTSPFRVPCSFQDRSGHVLLEKRETVPVSRLQRHPCIICSAGFLEGNSLMHVQAMVVRLGQAAKKKPHRPTRGEPSSSPTRDGGI